MLGQDPRPRRLADGPGALRRERRDVVGHVLAVAGDQHLLVRLQEQLDPLPGVGDQAAARPRRLEHPRRRREADRRHGVAGDVENRERAGVEGVVLARIDVAQMADVGRHGLGLPAVPPDQEPPVREPLGRRQEEGLHPRLPIGQAVAQERQVGPEPLLGRDRMVGGGIEGVVDRDAALRPETLVGAHHRRAAAVGQDHVEPGQGPTQRVPVPGLAQLVQRRGRVHVPEDADRVRGRSGRHPLQQKVVENPDAAGLDHHVGLARLGDHRAGGVLGGGIDLHPGPGGGVDVPVLLPFERVRLVEHDVVAPPGEVGQQPPIVGRRPVPVGGQEARSVEGDLHRQAVSKADAGAASLSSTASSSSVRWAQVWRARMVSSPWATREARRSASSRTSARARTMAASSSTIRKSWPTRNSPSLSRQGAETRGIPQASASNTRMVGMPGKAVT